ncbi:uncharacterized protein LOC133711335 [Rosa rugosa]|uniref:uncharacterized protein LOC133711335 n=1 Tax=Rosa rugosa TaxID=74645 RepID=UPI002B412849|nr:uncharacterized protein LOC133711335 [Rosa rugosa]
MEHSRDRAAGGSVNSPPWFNGGCEKYTQWKIYMKSNLYAQDEHVWNIVENGWKVPVVPAKGESSSTAIPKPRKDWTEEEVHDLQADFKAKNNIFTALSEREKLRISHCDTAKQAWDLLQTTYEGNKKVRAQKLQGLIYEFETMTMRDDETVDNFHGRILKITGQCRSLGALFDEDKVVKKILRALPEKFHSKVTGIEDSFDIDDYPLDELIGNLKTYELRLKPEKKSTGVAFKAVKVTEEEDEPMDLALLTKEFKKFLKSKTSSRNSNAHRKNSFNSGSSDNNAKSGKGNFKGNNYGKTKCYECGGYGHISTDCGNMKHGNSNNKSLLSTWSDDETQGVENVAFVSSLSLESDSDESFSDDETTVRCKQLYKASKATLIKNPNLEEEIQILKVEKNKLELMWKSSQTAWEQERTKFTDELRNSQGDKSSLTWKTECAELKNKSKMLELEVELKSTQEKFTKFEIRSGAASKLFGSGKAYHDTSGLGYSGESSKSTRFVKEMNLVVEKSDLFIEVIKETNTGPKKKGDNQPKHHQNVKQVKIDQGTLTGQSRPRCNERLTTPLFVEEKLSVESLHCELKEQKVLTINKLADLITKVNMQTKTSKPVWIRKDLNNHLLARTDSSDSLNSIDATCLMACVSTDNTPSHIEATCLVALTALADKRRNFWYVDNGCSRHMTGDKGWFSSFQDECTTGSVTFGDGRKAKILARGTVNTLGVPNFKNVLYVEGLTANLISVSHLADDYKDVWLGHVNYQDLLKLSTKQCVRGLPTLNGKTDKVCGECKVGKQTKAPHKVVNSATTTQVLELLHMDLMGPAQTKSIGGLSQRMIMEKQSSNICMVRVRSDNGTEFKNAAFANYFHELGVSHEFSVPITPQHNGIVERKNRVLLDMARVMQHAAGLSTNFWAEAISTACYTISRVFLRPGAEQTASELWKDASSSSSSVSQDTPTSAKEEENVDSILEPAPQMRRGFKQVQKDYSSRDIIGKYQMA